MTQTVAGVKFSTLPGFAIERMNPPDKGDSYVVITFDSLGRLVVSKEQDFPRILLDNDKDGIYESEKVISDKIRNCQGLWFEGRTLYAACAMVPTPEQIAAAPPPAPGGGRGGPNINNRAGIFRLEDTNGDDVADTFEILAMAGSIQEHGPHAIRRRPDGGFSVIVGNNETIGDLALDLTSPVLKDKDAQFLPYFANFGQSAREGAHSAIFDWNPATKKFRVFSGGNRNAYDYAYNLAGEAFLFDSDMEWDIGLPWYREVRTAHQILNGNYGYRNGSGKYPQYYIDSLPPTRDLGRGSPVGVEVYSSYAYPREFFDNLFEADWSRGRLLYTALTPAGATYTTRTDRAEFVHGEPFNITDVEVGPDGLMYFTTGGRSTTGGLWRLRYTGTVPAAPDMTGILAVVRQPQPLSSWGWAAIEKVKATMGANFGGELEKIARSASAPGMDRARAIYEMQRHGVAPSAALLSALVKDGNADVRAAVTFVAGVQGEAAKAVAAAALKDREAAVRRRAGEAIVRMGQSPDKPSLLPVADVYGLLNDTDRFVRWAGRIAIEHTPRADWKDRVLAETNPLGAIEGMLAWVRTAGGESLQPVLDKQFAMLKQTNLSAGDRLRLYRTLMYTTTEVKGGLSRRPARAAERGDHRPVPGAARPEQRRTQPRARAPARLRRPAGRDREDPGGDSQDQHQSGAAAPLSVCAADDQAGLDAGRQDRARRGARPRVQVARRRAVHQLHRPVLRLGLRALRDRRREGAALREGAGLLTAHADRARRAPGAPGGSRRRPRWPRGRRWWRWRTRRRAGGPARGTNRGPRAQPSGDVRGNGVPAAAGPRRRCRPKSVRGQLRVVPQVRLGRHRPRGREPEPVGLAAPVVEGGAPRGGLLPESQARARTRDDRDRDDRRQDDHRSGVARGGGDGLDPDHRGRGDRCPQGANQVPNQDEDLDHAGRARRHDRPQQHAQPGGVPGGRATGRRRQRRAVVQ